MTSPENYSSTELLSALAELDAGAFNHASWLKELHRVLICDGEPNASDLLEDAHCRCKFGKWYSGDPHPEFHDVPGFEEIGVWHRKMHDEARLLLNIKAGKCKISAEEYDRFMDVGINFKLELRSLQTDIIQKMCRVDHLTGVWNRSSMQHQLEEEHERMRRAGSICCLVMMDLDHFKQVNDTYGHPAGDAVLQKAVQLFTGMLRKYDSIFRYGGEEFLFCLPDTVGEDAVQIMDRMRLELEKLVIDVKGKGAIQVTASFGVAVVHPDETVTEAIEKADHALFSAKSRGRNRVCLWQ